MTFTDLEISFLKSATMHDLRKMLRQYEKEIIAINFLDETLTHEQIQKNGESLIRSYEKINREILTRLMDHHPETAKTML